MITIRKAIANEVRKLQKLNNEVFIDNVQYDPDLVVNWSLSEKGANYFSKLLKSQKSACFIAEDNNDPIGYIAAIEKVNIFKLIILVSNHNINQKGSEAN